MSANACWGCTGGHATRRDFLRLGSLGALGITLPGLLRHQAMAAGQNAKAKSVILLWLEGGQGQVDSWDPKPTSSFKPISTNVPGIQISEIYPKTAKHMDKLAVIRSMHTEEIDHPEATYYAYTGHRPNPAMQFPSVGAILSKEVGPRGAIPPFVKCAKSAHQLYDNYLKSAFLGPEYDPMLLPDPNADDFEVADLTLPKSVSPDRVNSRLSFLEAVDQSFRGKHRIAEFGDMDTFQEKALTMILSPEVKDAFDLSQESDKTRDTYGRHGFGQSTLLARRLVEAGSVFVTAAGYRYSQWDTHGDNDKNVRDELAPVFDTAFSTLLEDLDQRGLLETTIVVAMGEFGRTPHVNPGAGRDHFPNCWSLVIGGGGIDGGQVVGASDERGAEVTDRMVTIGDLHATIYKAFGIDWTKTYDTPIGRPIKIANSIDDKTGQPIKEII